jgi:transcriptional regulator with XRE-family HTH domain
MTSGDKLKRLRVERGLSQEEVAAGLYFSNRTISSWENNSRQISAENLKRIAEYFHVPITYFYEDGVQPPKVDSQAYQQIRLKQIQVNDRYFFLLLGLIVLQAILIFFPFLSRINTLLITFIFWLGFSLLTVLRYIHLDRQRTKDYLLPLEIKAMYHTNVSAKERKRVFTIMLITYLASVIPVFMFYAGVYSLFNLNGESPTFLFFVVLYLLFMLIGHGIGFFSVLRRGVPKEQLDYDIHKYDFGMYVHRTFVTLHYVAIIFLLNMTSGLPLASTNYPLLYLILISGFFLIIYLRRFLNFVTKFFASYRIDPLFHHEKNEKK